VTPADTSGINVREDMVSLALPLRATVRPRSLLPAFGCAPKRIGIAGRDPGPRRRASIARPKGHTGQR
jgi:hypothetical protein